MLSYFDFKIIIWALKHTLTALDMIAIFTYHENNKTSIAHIAI